MDIKNDTDEPVDYRITTEQTIIPVVGAGVTYLCGSDRYPFTIIKVNTANKLTIQEDELPRHKNAVNPHARTLETRAIRKHKNGGWYDTNGMQYRIGDREFYHDPSF